MALFVQRVEARENDAEVLGAQQSAERVGDFLLHLGFADGAFAEVVDERHGGSGYEQQHRVGMPAQALQQVEGINGLMRPALPVGLSRARYCRSPSARMVR